MERDRIEYDMGSNRLEFFQSRMENLFSQQNEDILKRGQFSTAKKRAELIPNTQERKQETLNRDISPKIQLLEVPDSLAFLPEMSKESPKTKLMLI